MVGLLGSLGATVEKQLWRRGVGHSHLGITSALRGLHSCVWLTYSCEAANQDHYLSYFIGMEQTWVCLMCAKNLLNGVSICRINRAALPAGTLSPAKIHLRSNVGVAPHPPPRLLSQAGVTFSECPPGEGWSHEKSVNVFISVFVF